MRLLRAAGILVVFVGGVAVGLSAQAPSGPAFDAASIKQNTSGSPRSGNQSMPGGRVSIINQPLRSLVRTAFGSNDLEVIGGPDWMDGDRWDILAAASSDNADASWPLMLKSLLADRFKLQAHLEPREQPIFNLVFARVDKKLGPGIHDAACKDDDGNCGRMSANTNGIKSGSITGAARTMTDLAVGLSPYAQRRVFDRTALEGNYDFAVQWSEELSIFTAVQEQLGLKLESARGPVDVVVIDHVERPTEN